MDIFFLGHSSFRIKGKTATLVTDPYDSGMIGIKFPRTQAEIVTVSHDHGDHNKVDEVSGVKKVVSGPGEYEILGISIIGISSFHDDKKGSLRGKNTIYVIEVDGLRIAHLGDLGHKLSEKILGMMGNIDILLIPTGGEYTVGSAEAAEIVRSIEPGIAIPMHYQTPGLKGDVFKKLEKVDPFLSDLGLPIEKHDKLTIKKESLSEENKVVLLQKK